MSKICGGCAATIAEDGSCKCDAPSTERMTHAEAVSELKRIEWDCGKTIEGFGYELQPIIAALESSHEPSVEVAGDILPISLWQFEQRAQVLLSDEQAKPLPDNALIDFICNAVRLARENERMAKAPLSGEPSGDGWRPIETAPKDRSVILYCNEFVPLYIGRKRFGNLGEPTQDVCAWRCDSSGRYATPTMWRDKPQSPTKPEKL